MLVLLMFFGYYSRLHLIIVLDLVAGIAVTDTFNTFSTGTIFTRQNLTSVDVRL